MKSEEHDYLFDLIDVLVIAAVILMSQSIAWVLLYKNYKLKEHFLQKLMWMQLLLILSDLLLLLLVVLFYLEIALGTDLTLTLAIITAFFQCSRSFLLWCFAAQYWILAQRLYCSFACTNRPCFKNKSYKIIFAIGSVVVITNPFIACCFYNRLVLYEYLLWLGDFSQIVSCLVLIDAVRIIKKTLGKKLKS